MWSGCVASHWRSCLGSWTGWRGGCARCMRRGRRGSGWQAVCQPERGLSARTIYRRALSVRVRDSSRGQGRCGRGFGECKVALVGPDGGQDGHGGGVGGVDRGAGLDRSGRGLACGDGRLDQVAAVDSLVGQVTKDRLGVDEQGGAPERMTRLLCSGPPHAPALHATLRRHRPVSIQRRCCARARRSRPGPALRCGPSSTPASARTSG